MSEGKFKESKFFMRSDEEKDDTREEDTLASIFSKKKKKKNAKSNPLTSEIPSNTEKLAENTLQFGTAFTDEESNTVSDETPFQTESPLQTETPFQTDSLAEEPYYIEDDENFYSNNKRRGREQALFLEQRLRKMKAKQSRRTFSHIFGSVLLVIFIVSVSVYFSYYIIHAALDFTGISTNEFNVEIDIPENATTEEIADILFKNDLIRMPGFFAAYSGAFGFDGKYLNGLFSLSSSMSYGTIINTLQSNDYRRQTVTVRIREGMTAEEIALLLEENYVCRASDFEYYYKNKQNIFNFEKRVLTNSLKFYQLEGYLFPDTYEFFIVDKLRDGKETDTSENAKAAVNKIYNNYNSVITKEMYKKMNEMGFTLDEFMTIASMVQAEAASYEDMRLVASVFINRLKNSEVFPYLQSDPTGYYAQNFIKPHVTPRNIGLYQPLIDAYDTYLTPGLPPGPICNPGIDAINAVFDAPATDYFYFCANIETRVVYFASNITQHEANLAKVAAEMEE